MCFIYFVLRTMVWAGTTANKNRELPWEKTDLRQVEHYISLCIEYFRTTKESTIGYGSRIKGNLQ